MGLENSKFSLKMPQRMQYTPLGPVVDFIEALGTWAEESIYTMAVKELSVFCCWEEDGTLVKSF